MDMKPEDSILFDPMTAKNPKQSYAKTRKLVLPQNKVSEFRKKLLKRFPSPEQVKKIKSLSNDQILQIGQKLGFDK